MAHIVSCSLLHNVLAKVSRRHLLCSAGRRPAARNPHVLATTIMKPWLMSHEFARSWVMDIDSLLGKPVDRSVMRLATQYYRGSELAVLQSSCTAACLSSACCVSLSYLQEECWRCSALAYPWTAASASFYGLVAGPPCSPLDSPLSSEPHQEGRCRESFESWSVVALSGCRSSDRLLAVSDLGALRSKRSPSGLMIVSVMWMTQSLWGLRISVSYLTACRQE